MPIELVVFDMAGTTVKDKNFVGIAFQQAMASAGYDIAVEDVNPLMGYEKPVAIKMMLNTFEPEKEKITETLINTIHTEFVEQMIRFYRSTDQLAPLPNVEETFRQLREMDIKIALDTGFSRDIADIILFRLGWEDKVDMMVASDEVENGRPAPEMIHKIMKELGVSDPSVIAKVGDTEVDINEGINAGCKYVIGITTGAFTREELLPYNPTHIVDDISEVLSILTETAEYSSEKN